MPEKFVKYDSWLKPYEKAIDARAAQYKKKRAELVGPKGKLIDFANGHEYFGIFRTEDACIYREWAPAADAVYFIGDFNDWNQESHPMTRKENGVWEIVLPGRDALKNGQHVKALVWHSGRKEERIPSYAHYVVQDPDTLLWSCVIFFEDEPFAWHRTRISHDAPMIYECHVGMATEREGVGTYKEFTESVLPRIKADGYNTIQLMGIMEHPYYASLGYQVSNFFAASSRFGTPLELKELIDTAHKLGLRVLLDVIHSHAVTNHAEGLPGFDGTDYQYFHEGGRGDHPQWGTKLFDYGKNAVLHFLLSNLKYWMTEYHFDGFRFDGVTSMIYMNHGIGTVVGDYSMYFSDNVDVDALTYLTLANELIHSVKKTALTIAEDVSGYPGMCIPVANQGIGFDYRLNMGVPDLFARLAEDVRDEDWDMWLLWYELTGRRPKEKVVGYVESHDQAINGGKALIFRFCDKEMYWFMSKNSPDNILIDRGMALHKITRLMTFTLAGEGYLNFMGNEFGHPEWIDFPQPSNGYSYARCRRYWSFADRDDLKYKYLGDFDKAMLELGKQDKLLPEEAHSLWVHQGDKVMIYSKGDDVVVINLNPGQSFTGYFIPVNEEGDYRAVLTTDDPKFGGFGRVDTEMVYHAETVSDDRTGFLCYLPSRTATVFRKVRK